MANKKTDEYKLTNKDKKKIKEDLIDEIKDDLTTEISKSLIDEVNKSFDDDYKDELKSKISDEISDDIKKDIQKEERRLTRKKNFKIVRLYIYIVLLIALVCFVIYKIYETDNLNILGIKGITTPAIVVNNDEETTKTTENLVDKYSSLMDNIKITNKSLLDENIKVEEMDITTRIALAYNTLTSDDIEVEDSIYTVDSSKIENAYNKLFNTADYVGTSFEVNGLNYKYSTKTSSYIAISEDGESKDDIIFEVSDITEDDTYVYIDALTAIHVGNYIYSKNNLDSSVAKYQTDIDLSKYSSKLTTTRFVFEKSTSGNYLYAIYQN